MPNQHPIFRHMDADGRPPRRSAARAGDDPVDATGIDELDIDLTRYRPEQADSPDQLLPADPDASAQPGPAAVKRSADGSGRNGAAGGPAGRGTFPPQSSVFDQALSPNPPMMTRTGRLRRALARLMPTRTQPNTNPDAAPDAPHAPLITPDRPTSGDAPGKPLTPKVREKLVAAMQGQLLRAESRGRLVSRAGKATPGLLMDVLVAAPGEPKLPDEVFPRLRWGGLFAYIAPSEKSVRNLAEAFDGKRGFAIEQPVTTVHAHAMGLRIPGVTPKGYAFTARKLQLIQPGDTTERFTYNVELTRCDRGPDTPDGYLVTKRVPTFDNLFWRLKQKFPEVDQADLSKRARKLVDHVFPTFLTREAAILGILQSNLAPEYCHKVPKPLAIEKDARGFVRTLHMNWMRVGGEPITQLQFAAQSAELLAALHEQARIMHLDLRLDNMVITPDGVGFVDFGSACRIGEEIDRSPMLNTLFSEMMRTSQIQRMLGKMIERGHVTNNAISEVHGKVDKTVDSFYLAVQITKPHGNPELRQLIDFDPESNAAKALSSLTAAVLRPKNPEMAHYKSATDVLRGIRRIERRVGEDSSNA